MGEIEIKKIIHNIDFPKFKYSIKKIKEKIQAFIEDDPEPPIGAYNFIESVERMQKALSGVNSSKDITPQEFEEILPDFLHYIQYLAAAVDEGDEESEFEFSRQLEEIDVEEFKSELVEFKELLDEIFGIDEELDQRKKQSKNKIVQLIEKLEKSFSKIKSINDLDQKEIDFIRHDFDSFIQYSDLLFAMHEARKKILEEDDEFDEDDLDPETDFEEDELDDELSEEFKALHQQWFEQFFKSPQFNKLSAEQKQSADFTLTHFSKALECINELDPASWNKKILEEVCLEIFPHKIVADYAYFNRVGPILTAFFNFLSENKFLKQAWILADYLQMITKNISEAAADTENWSLSKAFAMEVRKEKGIVQNISI